MPQLVPGAVSIVSSSILIPGFGLKHVFFYHLGQNLLILIILRVFSSRNIVVVVVVRSLSRVQLFATPWTAIRQASLSFSWSLLKFMSTDSVMLSNLLILCYPLLLLPEGILHVIKQQLSYFSSSDTDIW